MALASPLTAPKRRRLDLCSRKSADQWQWVEKLSSFCFLILLPSCCMLVWTAYSWSTSDQSLPLSSHLLHVAGGWAQEVLIVRLVPVPVVQHQVHRHLSLQTADVAVAEVVAQLMDLHTNTDVCLVFLMSTSERTMGIFLRVKFRYEKKLS